MEFACEPLFATVTLGMSWFVLAVAIIIRGGVIPGPSLGMNLSDRTWNLSGRHSLGQKNSFVEVTCNFRVVRGAGIVRDHDDGLLRIAVQLFQNREDFIGGLSIKIAGRLIGQN